MTPGRGTNLLLTLAVIVAPLGSDGFVDYDHRSRRGAERVADAIIESGMLASP